MVTDDSMLLRKGAIFAFALSTVCTVAWAGGASSQTRGQVAGVQRTSEVAGVSFHEANLDDRGFIDATEAKELDLDVQHEANDNGAIDRTEWQRAPQQAQAGEPEPTDPPSAETGAREPGAPMQSAADAAGVSFQEADVDDSDAIDDSEAKELGLDVVRYDTNQNGVIDESEWERAPGQATEPDRERQRQ